MTEGAFDRLDTIFHEALEREPGQREAFVVRACEGDVELRARVEKLLVRHGEAHSFLESPPTASIASRTTQEVPDEVDGMRIGRFRVRRAIGSGGMGVVYEAEQDQPHRLVALKVLRHSATSRNAMKRFEHEAEILGQLRHPNIAQIFEAGTHDQGDGAQPYFAMELIRGRALIQYCEAGNLSTRARLELFVKACDAVQYAHHKGVIHRDLKPDNILVDDFGEPKILDFGIARATGSDLQATTLRTDIGQLIGTVPYMSPEQVTGDPGELDTRSDVYSLGVVFYELMCGKLPHDLRDKNIPEAVRVIREEDPRPLSSISRIYRGDIDTIVSKALEKEKERRYQTAAELAADIRHYLADEPIVARPASTFYQLRKFARRNRTLVGGVGAVMTVLVLGTVVAVWLAVRASSEAAKATAVSSYLMEMLADLGHGDELYGLGAPDVRGPVTDVQELADRAAERLETAFPDWPDVRADMHFRLALTYYGLAQKSGRHEHLKARHEHFQRAYELHTGSLGEDHPDTLLALLWVAGSVRMNQGPQAAEPVFRQAAEGFRRQFGDEDRRTLVANNRLAIVLAELGKFEEAEKLARETIGLTRETLGDDHRFMFMAMSAFGTEILTPMGKYDEAQRVLREALGASRRALPEGDSVPAVLAGQLMGSLVVQGKHSGADEQWRAFREDLYTTPGNLRTALRAESELGSFLMSPAVAKLAKADAVLRDALARQRDTLEEDDPSTLQSMQNLGVLLQRRGQPSQAEPFFREAADGRRRVFGRDDPNTLGSVIGLARSLWRQEKYVDAEECFNEIIEGRQRGLGAEHRDTRAAMNELAGLYDAWGKPEKAAEWRAKLPVEQDVVASDLNEE